MKKRLKIILPLVLVITALVVWRLKTNAFAYAGTVEATEVDISAKVASTLKTVDVREGDTVRTGQLLASFTGEDIRLAQASADEDFRRGQALYRSGSMPKEAFDRLRTAKELADLRLDWCRVQAPLDATVLTRYHEPGEFVGMGAKLFTLADLSEVWCQVYVPQPLLVKLSPGQKLTAHLPEMAGKTFEGTLARISGEAEFTPKNVQTRRERERLVYAVKVTFLNPEGLLKPGMTLEVQMPE